MKYLCSYLAHDIRNDPFYTGRFRLTKVLLCSIGIRATAIYRFSHYLYLKRRLSAAYFLQRRNLRRYGLDIAPAATLGEGLRILHTSGIVIGAGVIVGKNCTILHGVTLGVKNILRPAQERDFPQIGSDVTLAAYVSIFGRVIIQDASFIPAHATIVEGAREKQKVVRKSKTGGHW